MVKIGKSLLELVLCASDSRNISFKDKLFELDYMSKTKFKKLFDRDEQEKLNQGITLDHLEELDVSMLHKLIRHLCCLEEKDPELEKELRIVKDCRNNIAHCADNTEFTDFFIWQKIEELRASFIEILNRVNNLYCVDIKEKEKQIHENINKISRKAEFVVGESEVSEFLNQLNAGLKCPLNLKVEIKRDPRQCSLLDNLLRRLGSENTRIKLFINTLYYNVTELDCYDSKKHLLPLFGSETCQLSSYRGKYEQ
ncbi:unnamed protein product [Meganyctiphanes norvegica]|uniref:DZIP3-like HEPN domain-containing protein n=1 Tax=Meganyctiphanes norvegica TaxID=48144 RepID=A0AAV2RXK9_MEGNR